MAGGLGVPRPAAEIAPGYSAESILQGKGQIINNLGEDVTSHFLRGAEQALQLAQENDVKLALLKSSPSCSNHRVYSGEFNGVKIIGSGLTAALLSQNGIEVFNEGQLDLLEQKVNGKLSF